MAQLLEFSLNHWFLVNLFIVLIAIIFLIETKGSIGGFLIGTQELVKKMNRDKALVLDLRPKDDYRKGHIANAISIDKEKLLSQKKYQQKPIVLVCQTGQESVVLQQQLKKQGYESVTALKGGLKTWLEEGLPLVQKQAANG
jgi:rhodanese-related sulfurtransferase